MAFKRDIESRGFEVRYKKIKEHTGMYTWHWIYITAVRKLNGV
jgi:hypothetical protein